MKRLISGLLSLCLLAGLALPVSAATDSGSVQAAVQALGIMSGDESGNLNLSRSVTRAEFAKMLVAASSYKDTIQGGSGASPYKDVKYTHWAADYVSTVVSAGWMTGYVDGSFRPDQSITYEEGASAILKLLGYGTEDLSGTYPQAQISKFVSLKLAAGISPQQGRALSRNECMYMFYNLMSATTKDGKVYGTTLGYTMDANGDLDYDALVKADMEGPFVLSDGKLSALLPFDVSSATIYRNGKQTGAEAVAQYDVIYYHLQNKTVWAYSTRIIGVFTAVSPSAVTPESVTVAGNDYAISSATAKAKLSATGSFKAGDTVALLLGMDGDVVDVISAALVDGSYSGVVTKAELASYANDAANSSTLYLLSVACTDGVTRQCAVDSIQYYAAGNVVSVSYVSGEATVKKVSAQNLSGSVNSAGTMLGSHRLAADVEIMDVTKDGDWTILQPSRLAGTKLAAGDIRYSLKNTQGEITQLILGDATGDLCAYGIVTYAKEEGETSSYRYQINGVSGSLTQNGTKSVKLGPALFYGSSAANDATGGAGFSISRMENLSAVPLTSISSLTATGASQSYRVAEGLQVYRQSKTGDYELVDLSVVNGGDYQLTGYRETKFAAGGLIRVVVAVAQ